MLSGRISLQFAFNLSCTRTFKDLSKLFLVVFYRGQGRARLSPSHSTKHRFDTPKNLPPMETTNILNLPRFVHNNLPTRKVQEAIPSQ